MPHLFAGVSRSFALRRLYLKKIYFKYIKDVTPTPFIFTYISLIPCSSMQISVAMSKLSVLQFPETRFTGTVRRVHKALIGR